MSTNRKHFTLKDLQDARRASKDKYRAKPGVREHERIQARERRAQSAQQKMAEQAAIESCSPTDVENLLLPIAKPIDPTWVRALDAFRRAEITDDDWIWLDWEPSEQSCVRGGERQLLSPGWVTESPITSNLCGRLARHEWRLGMERFEMVFQADEENIQDLQGPWYLDLIAAEKERLRWAKLSSMSGNNSPRAKLVALRYEWAARHSYYLAESLIQLRAGRSAFLESWEEGRLKNTIGFLWNCNT